MTLRSTERPNHGLIFMLVLSFVSHQFIHGQSPVHTIKFSNISIKDGLSQSSPNFIFQDSRGFIWIGTEDGLNKYDGYSFTVYKPLQFDQNSISNSRMLSITEDHSGDLWIGTNGGGLNKYIRNTDKFLSIGAGDEPLAGNRIPAISPFGTNGLWIGTDMGPALLDIETGTFSNIVNEYPALQALAGIPVNALLQDDPILWMGTANGLFGFNTVEKTLQQYSMASEKKEAVTALLIDSHKNLIIGTENGVYVFDKAPGTITPVRLPDYNNNGSNGVKALLEDGEGNIWIATFGNGLYIGSIQTGKFENYLYDHLNPYSIRNNEVLSLFKDFSGLIWVGTNGIDIYNPLKEKFVLYDYVPYSREQSVFRNIHPIYLDKFNVLWIGSKTDGLHILNRSNKTYTGLIHDPAITNGLSSNRIRAIIEYPEGVLWVGTENAGLDKVYLNSDRKPIRFKNYRHEDNNPGSLSSNLVYTFFVDDSGKLWIGTDNGLTIMDIDTETLTQYLPDISDPKSISNSTVYAIYGDRQNNIWLATDLGINKYDPSSDGFIHYIHDEGNENSVVHNEILCFHEDTRGKLWIGTYGKGFDKYDPVKNVFTHFSEISDIATAVIYGILEDTHGNLWMSTNNGILKFNENTREVKKFSIEDGLQSNEFNGSSYFITGTSEMFFGGQFGFNSFYPDEVQVDTITPKIVFSDLLIHNVSVIPGESSPLNSHIAEANEIVLNHNQNNFTLYFSALHFANSERNRYMYKLEGFDKDWIDAGNKRFVTYTNLPYKTYKFIVKAANNDGVWNEEGISIKVKVTPPIWATLWFRIMMGLLLAGVLGLIVRRRLTRDERHKRIIEEKLYASSKELEEARVKLEQQRSEIVIQKRELISREKDQENLLWFNEGLGKFSDLINRNRENLNALCAEFIENLVKYIDAQQGGVFLFNDEYETDPHLELVASYVFSSSRAGQRFKSGEGYVGTCYRDKKFIEIDNLSENYSELSSGLGNMHIKFLVLAPLMVNNDCIGVVELGSFKKIKGYRMAFIEKLAEIISSNILTDQTNTRLKKLIEQSTQQAKELTDNEEQMRQNMEELLAAQEESSRREDELIKLAEESATREEMLNQEIEILRNQLQKSDNQPLIR